MTYRSRVLPVATADAVVLLGPSGQTPEAEAAGQRLVPRLAEQLGLPAERCLLVFRYPFQIAALQHLLNAGCRRIVLLPFSLTLAEHQDDDVLNFVQWEAARNAQLDFRYGAPLGRQLSLVQALADRAAECLATGLPAIPQHETALALIGRGSNDPDQNADLMKLARLLWEGRGYGWVEAGFYHVTQPDVGAVLDRCRRLGARRIVILPYLLSPSRMNQRIAAQVEIVQARQPDVSIRVAAPLGDHPGVVETLVQNVQAALSARPRQTSHPHSGNTASHTHRQFDGAGLLPPRYRNGASVSAAPMTAAPLVYDAEGHVAWDKLWGVNEVDNPFCELALAGGPPHRGELLEPVTPSAVNADMAGYGRVLAELTRGIQLTTGLLTQLSRAPGWIGVQCHNEAMALWLLRAIVVENVSVRREGHVLYLPAGPNFRLEAEIKNVITALAKTHHYWQEHLRC